MSAALSGGFGDIRTSVDVIDIRPLTADVALVSCMKTVHDQRPDAEPTAPAAGALTHVTVQASTGWKIGLAQRLASTTKGTQIPAGWTALPAPPHWSVRSVVPPPSDSRAAASLSRATTASGCSGAKTPSAWVTFCS